VGAERIDQGGALRNAADAEQFAAVGGERQRGRGAQHPEGLGDLGLGGDVEFDVPEAVGAIGQRRTARGQMMTEVELIDPADMRPSGIKVNSM